MISSTKNEKIKYVSRLISQNSFRRKEKLIVVEGMQECRYAVDGGFEPLEFYLTDFNSIEKLSLDKSLKVFQVSESVFEKISVRNSNAGIVGLFREKPLTEIKLSNQIPLIIVLEGIEKPGNLGAIFRSALAFGVDLIMLSNAKTDPYHPHVIRNSVGGVFKIQWVSSDNEGVYEYLKFNNFKIFGTYLNEKAKFIQNESFFSEPTAIIFGEEHTGLSEYWKNRVDENILIEINQQMDSLNLSVSAAICMYEWAKKNPAQGRIKCR